MKNSAKKLQFRSIKSKMLVSILGITTLVFTLFIGAITYSVYQSSIKQAEIYAQSEVTAFANEATTDISSAEVVAKTLASSMEGMKNRNQTDRDLVIAMIEENLRNNENILGIWTCWEPNLFDGNDATYQNQPAHDVTGRFIPYVYRDGSSIAISPLESYDKNGAGDYYLKAFTSGKEVVLEPFEYKIGDKMVTMTTIAIPIRNGSTIVGVTGVDIELSTLQSVISDIKLYDTGYAEMISNQGIVLAHPDSKYMGTDIFSSYSDSAFKNAITKGEKLLFDEKSYATQNNSLMAIAPMRFGEMENPWSLMVVIPHNEITASASKSTLIAVMGGIIAMLFLVIVIYRIAISITKPIIQVNTMIQEMTMGHLSMRLKIDSADEVGKMAQSMNQFADDLQNVVIGTMNQISEGNVSANIVARDSQDEIAPALKRTIETIQALIGEATVLSNTVIAGKLDTRVDTRNFSGGYKEILQGVNETIDTLVGFIDIMPNPAFIVDTDYSMLYINEAGAKAGGHAPTELHGMKCYDYFGTSDCNTSRCACQKAMANDQMEKSETDAHFKNGVNLDIVYAGIPIKNKAGEITGAFEFINDITSIKAAERLSTKIMNYQKNEINKLVAGLTKLSKGDTMVHISLEPGDQDTLAVKRIFENISESVNSCIAAIKNLVDDVSMIAQAGIDGRLETRANASRHQGDFAKIVNGVNSTMDAVVSPVKETSAILKELAQGNLNTAMVGNYNGDYTLIKDDMNLTITFLKRYVDEITQTLEQLGQGNLDQQITSEYLGDFDAIKTALNGITTTLSNTMSDIDIAAEQVEIGAQQISDGGQALSQGTTEQASSIQELTASIEEVAGETKKNALHADEANELAMKVRSNAKVGNEQMNAMVSAMIDINESSKSISKIIKVIDDIAFQTNILSLNAAVEAARAGQHGKGFAVVAEEVRALAARSAEAAKETTNLIESSIKSVETGTQIASQTEASLKEILSEIGKVTGLVGNIAQASNEQAIEIAQITQGIEQVSQVVQTNSATAEESAAASEELSGQAEILKQMVGTFKLKDNHNSHFIHD